MSDHGNFSVSSLQIVSGVMVFYIGFMGLFPHVGLDLQGWQQLPLSTLLLFVFIVVATSLTRLSGLGFLVSLTIPMLIGVFLLLIFLPSSPFQVGMMLISAFGAAVAMPNRN